MTDEKPKRKRREWSPTELGRQKAWLRMQERLRTNESALDGLYWQVTELRKRVEKLERKLNNKSDEAATVTRLVQAISGVH